VEVVLTVVLGMGLVVVLGVDLAAVQLAVVLEDLVALAVVLIAVLGMDPVVDLVAALGAIRPAVDLAADQQSLILHFMQSWQHQGDFLSYVIVSRLANPLF